MTSAVQQAVVAAVVEFGSQLGRFGPATEALRLAAEPHIR